MQEKCGEVKAKTDFLATSGQPELIVRTWRLKRVCIESSCRETALVCSPIQSIVATSRPSEGRVLCLEAGQSLLLIVSLQRGFAIPCHLEIHAVLMDD
jgi:hypothetical protein